MTKILRISLGIVLLLFGIITLFDFFTNGYNPQNADLLKFSPEFQSLHNGIMESYLAISLRILMTVCGVLLLLKKYWYIGLCLYMPLAINILAIHLLYDIPPAHIAFFTSGILVSVPAIILFWIERKRLHKLID